MQKLFCAILLLMSFSTQAQFFNIKTMRLFLGDVNSSLVNVYDLKKETLIKSINCIESVEAYGSRITFNKDETKLYRVGNRYAHIIDVATLESKKIELLDSSEINRLNSLRITTLTKGISENGIVVKQNILDTTSEYIIFDLKKEGKKVNTFELSAYTTMYDGNILAFIQDGTIDIIDPLSGKKIGKFENAFLTKDLADARANSSYYDKRINTSFCVLGNYLITSLVLGMSKSTYTFDFAHSIYDLSAKKIIFSQRNSESLPDILPLEGTQLFYKVITVIPKSQLKLPEAPDSTKFTKKDIKKGAYNKAKEEYNEKVLIAETKWKQNMEAYRNPQNFISKIFSDVNETQELFSIQGSKYIIMKGDFVFCYKELSIEVYDIKTKKLLNTIYFE
jgi:hypothetical protein